MGNWQKALHYITLAKENSRGALLTNSTLTFEMISVIQATCLKMTQNLDAAGKAYACLEDHFKRSAAKDVVALLWGLVVLPLADDRKAQADHYTNLREHLEHLHDAKVPVMDHQNLLLSRFCVGATADYRTGKLPSQVPGAPPKKLDFATYGKSIWTLLDRAAFFKRFANLKVPANRSLYAQVLRRAEVELYARDQAVFLKGRVGVVTGGSLEVRRHVATDLLKPYIVKKAIAGDVLGFAEGDDNASGGPLSWLVSIQAGTEVVFLSQDDWLAVWNLQKKFAEQQVVLQKLEQNAYFASLHTVTKYHLVYESLELKMYFPGQLIMSVHERSPLCREFQEYYRPGPSKFRREIDAKIMRQMGDTRGRSAIGGYLTALN